MKRGIADQIANEHIDAIYDMGLVAGALGGTLLGAGDGGFMLFFVPPERQESVRAGSRIAVYEPDGLENH